MTPPRLSECTPGPFRVGYSDGSGPECICADRPEGEMVASLRTGCGCCQSKEPLTKEEQANADLLALAYDHALLLAAIVSNQAETGFIDGKPYIDIWNGLGFDATDVALTPFGTPALTPDLRRALQRAVGVEAKT